MLIKVDTSEVVALARKIGVMQKQVAFAAAVALTRTAKAVKETLPDVMERELDRPTPFTKGGLFVKPARKDDLRAVVGFKDRQASYMRFQIEGGTRYPSSRGIKLPGNIELNAFGNIPKGVIDKLKQAAKSGKFSSAVSRRLGVGNRRKGAAPIQLFYGRPAGRDWENAPVGIWRRIPGQPGKLIPVVVFEDSPARYEPRFQMRRAAKDVVHREWDRLFREAFAEAVRTAR